MKLTHNEKTGAFILTTFEKEPAENAGLTLSTNIRGSKGEYVYYTANYSKQPEFNAYSVLNFAKYADGKAEQALEVYLKEYKESWAEHSDYEPPAPPGMEYMSYQKAGIKFALDRGDILIADEPGLGKTIQAIGIINANRGKRNLILCPANIRLGWQREIHAWSTIHKVRTYPILKGSDGVSPCAHYVICSYDLARDETIHELFCSEEWDNVVLDEAHYLKSFSAQRTRSVFGGGAPNTTFAKRNISDNAKKIIGLTGTPLPNRPRECYTIARGLNWESIDWMSADSFTYRFNPSAKFNTGHIKEMTGRLPELNARLRCNFMIRRLKKTVLPQLPDKRYEMTHIEPNGAIRKVLAKENLIDFNPEELFNPDFSLDGTPIATLRREMGEAKVPRVIEHIKYLMDIVEEEKVVMFAHHKDVIKTLGEKLSQYDPVYHVGGMSTVAKEKSKDRFIKGDSRLFIGQLDTMEGVDGLQDAASHVVFAEPAWTPGRNEQCVDRCHRHGQHGNVVAQFLIVENSMDDKVLNAVLNKTKNVHTTLDEKLV
jgi:SWI/SNF-related matrix-associated actin-dependent regulator 1 of chromatin subfamily A